VNWSLVIVVENVAIIVNRSGNQPKKVKKPKKETMRRCKDVAYRKKSEEKSNKKKCRFFNRDIHITSKKNGWNFRLRISYYLSIVNCLRSLRVSDQNQSIIRW